MTHAALQTHQHSHGLAEILQKNSKLPTRLARDHPFREGHEQARLVLGPEQGTEQEQLPQHATKALQQNPEQRQYKEKSAEAWHNSRTHQASLADSDKHPMHTAPPAPRHHHHDSENTQNPLNEKYRHNAPAPWSARHHPLGEGHGHTSTVLGPVQGSEHGLQILANKELQMQILHPARGSEVRPRHQTRTPQKTADIQSCPMRTIRFAPRYHTMGGSYADLTREENGLPREPLSRISSRAGGGCMAESETPRKTPLEAGA